MVELVEGKQKIGSEELEDMSSKGAQSDTEAENEAAPDEHPDSDQSVKKATSDANSPAKEGTSPSDTETVRSAGAPTSLSAQTPLEPKEDGVAPVASNGENLQSEEESDEEPPEQPAGEGKSVEPAEPSEETSSGGSSAGQTVPPAETDSAEEEDEVSQPTSRLPGLKELQEELRRARPHYQTTTSGRIVQVLEEIDDLEAKSVKLSQYAHRHESAGNLDRAEFYKWQREETEEQLQQTQKRHQRLMETERLMKETAAKAVSEGRTLEDWFEKLEPGPKMLAILLCLFREISWEDLSEIFEYVIELFGGRDKFLSEPEKQERREAAEKDNRPLLQLDSIFDVRFSHLTQTIYAYSMLDDDTKCVMIAYPKDEMQKLFDHIVMKYFDVLLKVVVGLIQYGGRNDLSLDTRWLCANAVGRVLNVGATYLLRNLVQSWVLVDDTRSDAKSLRAAVGHTFRHALEEGTAKANDIRLWFHELCHPRFLRLDLNERIVNQHLKWTVASACKEIGLYDPMLAMEQLYHLYKPDESTYVRDAVQYSQYALVVLGKYRAVFVAASKWAENETRWEHAELYLWNFVRLLDFYIRNAEPPSSEGPEIDEDNTQDALRHFLMDKDDEVDKVIANGYRSIAIVIDFELWMLTQQPNQNRSQILHLIFNQVQQKAWQMHMDREKLYRSAFACLRNWVFKFGVDEVVCQRVRNILSEIVNLTLKDAKEHTTKDFIEQEEAKGLEAVSAILRVMRLINEMTEIWQTRDINRLETSEDEKERFRLKNLRQMLIDAFNENHWEEIAILLIQIAQCQQESINRAAYELIETVVRWAEKFDKPSHGDGHLSRVADAFVYFLKRLDIDVPVGLKPFELRQKRIEFQEAFSKWSKSDKDSTRFKLAKLIFNYP